MFTYIYLCVWFGFDAEWAMLYFYWLNTNLSLTTSVLNRDKFRIYPYWKVENDHRNYFMKMIINCFSWINEWERLIVGNISWSISTKEYYQTQEGSTSNLLITSWTRNMNVILEIYCKISALINQIYLCWIEEYSLPSSVGEFKYDSFIKSCYYLGKLIWQASFWCMTSWGRKTSYVNITCSIGTWQSNQLRILLLAIMHER